MSHQRRRDAPIGGGLWVVASVLVPNMFLVVLSIATDRNLGAGGLGRQSVIAFVSGSATTVAGAGGFVAIMRAVAAALGDGDSAAARAVAGWGLRLHAVTGVVAGGAVALPVLWGSQPRAAWLLAAVVTVLATLQMAPMAVLVGAQRLRNANVVGLVTGALGVPASILMLRSGGGIEGLFAVELVIVSVNLAWISGLARRALAGADPIDGPTRVHAAPPLRFAAMSAIGIAVTVVVWRRSELVILSVFSTNEEVARYSVAFAVSAILLTLSERFAAAMTPSFTSLVAGGDAGRLRVARARAMRLLFAATLPLAGCAAALGPAAIRLLYGDEYARSGRVLLLMLTTMAVLPVWTVSSALLAAYGDASSPLLVGLVAAAIDVALSIPLTRRDGALGAACASVVAQAAAMLLMHALTRRRAGPVDWDVRSLARSFVVAGVAGIAGWGVVTAVAGPAGLVAGLATALACVVVVAGIARPLTIADQSWLAGSLGGRTGSRLASMLARAART